MNFKAFHPIELSVKLSYVQTQYFLTLSGGGVLSIGDQVAEISVVGCEDGFQDSP